MVEQYPKSEYAPDSLQRMVWLRDRLASYEVHVASFYYKRNAFVAAAQRAKSAIEQYDGAPATQPALEILMSSYDRMNLPKLANLEMLGAYAQLLKEDEGGAGGRSRSPGGSCGRRCGGSRW